MLFFPLIHVKMPTIVGILTYMSGKNFMLNWVEHEKSFITSGPGQITFLFNLNLYSIDGQLPHKFQENRIIKT